MNPNSKKNTRSRTRNPISADTGINLDKPLVPKQQISIPDEQTIVKLNTLAKKYPFCIWYRHRNHIIL